MPNPHPTLGNGQHIGVSALVLAAALFSVQFNEDPVPEKPLTLNASLSGLEKARSGSIFVAIQRYNIYIYIWMDGQIDVHYCIYTLMICLLLVDIWCRYTSLLLVTRKS